MASPERSVKPSATVVGRAKNIVKYLKTYPDVQFLHFMCDAFQPLADLSLVFQGDGVTGCEAVEALETCMLRLVELKTTLGPKQKHVVECMVQAGNYQGQELSNFSLNTLEKERETVAGKLNIQTNFRN
jgi:hypothetical protein